MSTSMWIGGEFNRKRRGEIVYGLGSSMKRRRKDTLKAVRFVSMEEDDMKAKAAEDDEFLGKAEGIGEFEKHTKGIGMKLLKKMGYNGGGLGINQQGITAPIEPKLRPKNMGMGFNNHSILIHKEEEEEEEEEFDHQSQSRSKEKKHWSSTKKKYIRAEQVVAQAHKQEENVKVIDMRGPQVRVINLNNNALKAVRFVSMEEDDMKAKAGSGLGSGDEFFGKVGEFEKHTKGIGMKLLKKMGYNGGGLGINQQGIMAPIEPKLRPKNMGMGFNNYSILMHKNEDEEEEEFDHQSQSRSVPYQKLWSSMKKKTQEEEEMPQLLMHNINLIVDTVERDIQKLDINLRNERETVVALRNEKEKLQREAQRLGDMQEMMSILNQMGDKTSLESLAEAFIDLQTRFPNHACSIIVCSYTLPLFIRMFEGWHPSDGSAFKILSPWKTLFDHASWERLMVTCIVPKLSDVVHELKIDPYNQQNLDLDRFQWVQTWVGAVPTHHMLALMDIFFDKWQQVLHHWLRSGPDFEKVRRWFLGWKGLIHQDLCANEHVRFRLHLALQMMNRAVEVEGPEKSVGCGNETMMRLKDVIEIYAQEKGLVFKPKAGTRQDGHQIYGFGNLSILIDSTNQKLLALTQDGRWSLVSLEQLLDLQNRPKMNKRWH